ncbi:ufm1-specific protease 2, partial [Tachysurus ichikawai]
MRTRRKWEQLCGRPPDCSNENSRICSCHFVGGMKSAAPSVFQWNEKKLTCFTASHSDLKEEPEEKNVMNVAPGIAVALRPAGGDEKTMYCKHEEMESEISRFQTRQTPTGTLRKSDQNVSERPKNLQMYIASKRQHPWDTGHVNSPSPVEENYPIWTRKINTSKSFEFCMDLYVLTENNFIFRLKGVLELFCQLDSCNGAHEQSSVSKAFKDLNTRISSESLVFMVCNSPILLWPNKACHSALESVREGTPCRDVQQHVELQDGLNRKSSKRRDKKDASPIVVNLKLLIEISESGNSGALSLCRVANKQQCVTMQLCIDCVIGADGNDTLGSVCSGLVEALHAQLSDMEQTVLRYRKDKTLPVPHPFHFQLPESDRLLTVIYPAGVTDDQLQSVREELHRKHDLPSDRPYFRRANAFHFPGDVYKDGYLRNPHTNLVTPSIENTKLYVVRGVYSYHHYMQDRVNDNGWGCAYRSLQTICSWFQQQGYTERSVPTHKQIQQALVDMSDKEPSFVGSRQWIGSIEVQAVLNQLLGVDSKILFV